MEQCEFKAINLISEAFEAADFKYRIEHFPGQEEVHAGFGIDCGPFVVVTFIALDSDNDVAMRVFGLINDIPEGKRPRVMEVCNLLNHKVRYLKFELDSDGDVNVGYDFPLETDDNCVGKIARELFIRTMHILDTEYPLFMKALYSEEALA